MAYHNWITGIYSESDGIFNHYRHEDEIKFLRDLIVQKLGKDALWDENGEYRFTPKTEYSGFTKDESKYKYPTVELKVKLLRHYGIRYVMVESGYLKKEEFYDEVIEILKEYGAYDMLHMETLRPFISKLNGWANFLHNVKEMVKEDQTDQRYHDGFQDGLTAASEKYGEIGTKGPDDSGIR